MSTTGSVILTTASGGSSQISVKVNWEQLSYDVGSNTARLKLSLQVKYSGSTSFSQGGYWYGSGAVKVNGVSAYDAPSSGTNTLYNAIKSTYQNVYDKKQGSSVLWVYTFDVQCDSDGRKSIPVAVNTTLYNDSTHSWTVKANGNIDIINNRGLLHIDNGATFEQYMPYIDNGSAFEQYIPYIDNGSDWEICV